MRAALALCVGLSLLGGCTYSDNPDIDNAIKRQRCDSFTPLFGGVIEYLTWPAMCEIDGPQDPVVQSKDERWQSLCEEAKAGDRFARAAVGRRYRDGGHPVSQNPIEAYKWFALADQAGHKKAAEYRDDVGTELTSDQIADARARIAAWSADAETCPVEGES